ncbi:DUF3000 domain-containing protein [Streptomonospora algeriensis]|uniref:DUF3000 domain-containing protein n=1 Tax=Streptomonospora algeriensis TaxID=995084 RepID=A0ABW3BK92_9ACTN
MPPLGRVDDAPPAFRRAVESLRAPAIRSEIAVEDIPAPKRLAPHSAAMSATVRSDGEDAAFGRLILLYDPDGARDWPSPFRFVVWVTADLESEIASDPLLGQVAWSWLAEALQARQAPHPGLSGTVTRATTEGFAGKADQPVTTELELRASWSPEGEELSADMQVWLDLLSAAAGLPPEDVADITQRRGRTEG